MQEPQNDQSAQPEKPAEAKVLPPEGQPKTPPAQTGDPVVEVAKPEAKPVLQSLEEGKAELDANPGRASVLTDQGHLTR